MKQFEAKIGKIEGYFPQKFIISEFEGGLRFDADHATRIDGWNIVEYYHKNIAEARNIEESKVLGGGHVHMGENGLLQLTKFSQKFGGVPHAVLEKFQPVLEEYYRGHYPEVELLDYNRVWDTAVGRVQSGWPEQTLKWQGYLE